MAFGPYLVMGAFIAMLWGNELFQWYLGLFNGIFCILIE